MSIKVDVSDIGSRLADYGDGFLLTTGGEQVKVLAVRPAWVEGMLHIQTRSGGTARNVDANPHVTLVFSPLVQPGLSLIVDGVATREDTTITITPESAILHQPPGTILADPRSGARCD